jgi:hypothetical protein
MMLSHEDKRSGGDPVPHPYWYARVIRIFHAEVRHAPTKTTRELEFLWVRWFGKDPEHSGGFKARRLHRVGFVPDDPIDTKDPTRASGAFGFVDPANIVRGVHLIPAFAHGRTDELLAPSIVRPGKDHDEDWQYFYVNM